MQPPHLSRRGFVATSALGLAIPTLTAAVRRTRVGVLDDVPPGYPTQEAAAVQLIVLKSHFDAPAVAQMVEKRPQLAKAGWDWGYGDWETALGAATHVGNREIIDVLLTHGARPDLFTFAVLGQVDVVRAICSANPGIQGALGPHGITLMSHARAGGDGAKAVAAYLEELGGADVGQPTVPLSEAEAAPYVGAYTVGAATFVVAYSERFGLQIKRDAGSARNLRHRGNHVFNPSGGPGVDVRFDVQDDMARSLTIVDGDRTIVAERGDSERSARSN